MKIKYQDSEYKIRSDGTEVCPECGHRWIDLGISHYPDCRYFSLNDESDDEIESFDLLPQLQMSFFGSAA